jgi:hypothetical protein
MVVNSQCFDLRDQLLNAENKCQPCDLERICCGRIGIIYICVDRLHIGMRKMVSKQFREKLARECMSWAQDSRNKDIPRENRVALVRESDAQ